MTTHPSPDPELAHVDLFRNLPAADLEELKDRLQRLTIPAGTLIMTSDQPGEAIYVILEGTLKIFLPHEKGREVILAIVGTGQTVGEMSLLDSTGRSASVMAMEPCTLLWMDNREFRRLLKQLPNLSYNLINLLSRRLRLANDQIQALSSLDVGGRVARQILAFAHQVGVVGDNGAIQIPLRLTQGDLASLIGTSRERVNRAVVRFKSRGWLSVGDGYRITVHDRRALAERCHPGGS